MPLSWLPRPGSHPLSPTLGLLTSSLGLFLLASCGNPNVPLTRPPAGAFRTTPVPAQRQTPQLLTPTPSPGGSPVPGGTPPLSLLALTAQFFDVPWPPPVPPSVLTLAAQFFNVPWPPPVARPTPGSAALNSPAPGLNDNLSDDEIPLMPLLDSLDLDSLDFESIDGLEDLSPEDLPTEMPMFE